MADETDTHTASTPAVSAAPPTKPDEAAFQRQEAALLAEVKECNARREKAQSRIEGLRKTSDEVNARFGELITKLQALRAEKKELEQQRDALRTDRDTRRAAITTMTESSKSIRSKLKAGNLDDIARKLAALEAKQSSETLSLKEEKDIIREIEVLRSARSAFSVHSDLLAKTETARDEAREMDKVLSQRIDGMYEAVRGKGTEITTLNEQVDGLKKKRDEIREELNALFKERDEARTAGNDKFTSLREVRDVFYGAKKAYTAYITEQARIKQAERAAAAAAAAAAATEGGASAATDGTTAPAAGATPDATEDEDVTRALPWAAEIRLCDMLLAHIIKLKPSTSSATASSASAPDAAACLAAVSGGGGPKLTVKKDAADELAAYKPKNAKGKGGGAKGGDASAASVSKPRQIVLDVSLLSSFTLIDVPPPTTTAELDDAISAVNAKREYYLTAPPPPPKPVEAPAAAKSGGFGARGGRGARAGAATSTRSGVAAVGTKVKTPYGNAVVRETRADGMLVVDMTSFGARAYLQTSQVTAV